MVATSPGDGTFDVAPEIAVGEYPGPATLGDLDGDQVLDLTFPNWISNTVSVLLGVGHGTFGPAVDYPAGETPLGVAIHDVNGDQVPDMLVPSYGVLDGEDTSRCCWGWAMGVL